MKPKNLSVIFIVLVLTMSIGSFAAWTYVENHAFSLPYFGNGKTASSQAQMEKEKILPVPDFSFINQNGETITNDFVKNKVWVADFFFTRCGSICPKMTNYLKQVQEAYSKNLDVKIISFTCDPEHDSVEQLHNYAQRYQANEQRWQFATGDKKILYRFARKSLQIVATDGDGGQNDFIHSQNLVLVDRNGYIRGYYDGTDIAEIEKLIADLKKIL